MRLFKCKKCGEYEEMPDNERLVIHICGSADVVRVCPVCDEEFEFTEQLECKNCKANALAVKVMTGEIGLVDAIRNM